MRDSTRSASLCPADPSSAYDKSLWTIRHHPDLTLATRAVHAACVSLRNQGLLGKVTQRQIANWAGVGLRSVVRAFKQMVEAGILRMKRRGQGLPNTYELVASGSAKRAASGMPDGRTRQGYLPFTKKDSRSGVYRPPEPSAYLQTRRGVLAKR